MKFFSVLTVFGVCSCAVRESPTERMMIGLTEKFDRWDENGDGKLSNSELGNAEEISGVSAGRIIEFYDTDGDGMISLRESQQAVSRFEEAEKLTRQ